MGLEKYEEGGGVGGVNSFRMKNWLEKSSPQLHNSPVKENIGKRIFN